MQMNTDQDDQNYTRNKIITDIEDRRYKERYIVRNEVDVTYNIYNAKAKKCFVEICFSNNMGSGKLVYRSQSINFSHLVTGT